MKKSQKRKKTPKTPLPPLSTRSKLYIAAVFIWEFFIVTYIIYTKDFSHTLPTNDLMTVVLLIIFPPIIFLLLQMVVFALRTSRFIQSERFKEILIYVKENLNTFPVLMQLLASLALITAMFNHSLEYDQFLRIFILVAVCVSLYDAYKNDEIVFSSIFAIIGSIYNPFYPFHFQFEVGVVIGLLSAFLFLYKVSFILVREGNLEKNLVNVAKLIDSKLKELDRNLPVSSTLMIEQYIQKKHPSRSHVTNSMVWKEEGLSQFTFSVLKVFNDENAITVKGNDMYEGFHAMLLFYNKNVKCMLFLDPNATMVAKKLQKIMMRDFHYFYFEDASVKTLLSH